MAKWINCRKCGHYYHSSLSRCPECSAYTVTVGNVLLIASLSVVAIAVVIGVILGFNDKGALKVDNNPSQTDSKGQTESTDSTDKVPNSSNGKTQSSNESKIEPIQSNPTQNETEKEEETDKESSVTESVEDKKPQVKIGAVRSGEMYYITRPLYYLEYVYSITGKEVPFEEYAYGLTEEDKKLGFKKVTKNSDGSATAEISAKDFNEFLPDLLKSCIDVKYQLRNSPDVESIESQNNEEIFNVKMRVSDTELSLNDATNLTALGLIYLDLQYHQVGRVNEVTINVIFENGVTKTIKFPDAIKN